jgi:membrane-bound lytic murein transglycosylase D
VLLPWDNAAQFEARLATHAGPLASWTAWKAPRDMSVAQAADQHGVEADTLRELNQIPQRMLVKAGSTLLVPRNGKLDIDVPVQLADHGQLMLKEEIRLVRTLVKARKGETVAQLAQRYQISANQVADWNDLKPGAKLKPGQKLVLQLPQRATENTRLAKAPGGKNGRRTKVAATEPKKVRAGKSSPRELKVALANKKH